MRRKESGTAARDGDLAVLAGDLRVAAGQFMRRMRQQGSLGDLTNAQRSVLARLEREGPATTSALARAEGIRPQSMGVIISVLEEAGYVSGTPDPADARKTLVSLTRAAPERFAGGRLAREDWLLRAISTTLTPDERAQVPALTDLLRRLSRTP
jgi:DNA-binding MarR family transcriptional regulator